LNRLMQVKGCHSIPTLLDKVLIILVGDHQQVSTLPRGGAMHILVWTSD
jgi:hypothetical protein